MDATTRWETEAMRLSPQKRSEPPRPTAKRQTYEPGSGTFITLKEAEDATGIPANTLRKWVRKDAITSYLESDGETTLRMVELGSVKRRAQELGRQITVPPSGGTGESASQGGVRASEPRPPAGTDTTQSDQGGVRASVPPSGGTGESASQGGARAGEPRLPPPHTDTPKTPDTPEGSMLVPIDAWNKMLNQLGNLHEAGQQLAEARERAAKAETEAVFLRERLAEFRRQTSDVGRQKAEDGSEATPSPLQGGQASLRVRGAREPASPVPQPGRASETSQGGLQTREPDLPRTTSYWRYLTTGWRSRKKNR